MFDKNKIDEYFKKGDIKQVRSDVKHDEKIIITMTSFPARMEYWKYVLYSLINQTLMADKIILWLAKEEFRNSENDMPDFMDDLKEYGVQVEWCDNIKSYKKLIYALKMYPDDLLVTVDDDVFYPENMVEELYSEHLRFPECIIANRVHKIKWEKSKRMPLPYSSWEMESNFDEPSYNLMATGVGGVLYPNAQVLNSDVYRQELFTRIAPYADDIWFWAMAVSNKTKIKKSKSHEKLTYIDPLNERNGINTLGELNVRGGGNDRQIKKVIGRYPEIASYGMKEEEDNIKIIPIVYISDNSYIVPTTVSVQSLINTMKEEYLKIYLILDNVKEEYKEKLIRLSNEFVEIIIIEVDGRNLKKYNKEKLYVSSSSLYKFCISNMIPEYDKILYLDGDVIAKKNLKALYEIDISDYYLGAVADMTAMRVQKCHVGCKNEKYFNSGVLLINAKKFREDKLEEKLFKIKNENPSGRTNYMDQEALNFLLGDKTKYLSHKWNFMPYNLARFKSQEVLDFYKDAITVKDMIENVAILHITNKLKPWIYKNTFLELEWLEIYYDSIFSDMPLIRKNNPEVNSLHKIKYLKECNQIFKDVNRPIYMNNLSVMKNRMNSHYAFTLKENIYCRFRFPFSLIPPRSRIVIYGGGVVGKIFLQQIARSRYCHVVGVCDRNPKSTGIEEVPCFDLQGLVGLPREHYDLIIIAIEKRDIARDIYENLLIAGLPAGKIRYVDPAHQTPLPYDANNFQFKESYKKETGDFAVIKVEEMIEEENIVYLDTTMVSKHHKAGGIPRTIAAIYQGISAGGGNIYPIRYSERVSQYVTSQEYKYRFEEESFAGFEKLISLKQGGSIIFADTCWDMECTLLDEAVKHNLRIHTVIYDLIPILYPGLHPEHTNNYYETWIKAVIEHSDSLICISKAVADDVIRYYKSNKVIREHQLEVHVVHLGCDIYEGQSEARDEIRNFVKQDTTFLMVGTVEPRKNHLLAMEALKKLSSINPDTKVQILVLGRTGWGTGQFQDRMKEDKYLQEKVLWIKDASDSEVKWAYENCAALLYPSRTEGFGLPLAEASRFNLPIICSDIPVFREIAGCYADYFRVDDVDSLAKAIHKWTEAKRHPDSGKLRRYDWNACASEVMKITAGNAEPYRILK